LPQTTHCVAEVPGLAYRFPSPGEKSEADARPAAISERFSKVVLYASLDQPAADYLPVLLAAADRPVYAYASYLESVDLFTVASFYVSNSSCAIAGAPLRRLQQEQPPSSVHSLGQLLEWLGSAS
jgi:hypothetical protein